MGATLPIGNGKSKIKNPLSRAIESKEPERQPYPEYRREIRSYYDGFAGAFTRVSGVFTGHELLAGRLFGPEAFDVRGCKRILDAGCGNGRYLRFLVRLADADAELTAFDLSTGMLQRARRRVGSDRPTLVAADLTRLPYRGESFDAIVCGYVLEHLPDPLPGLRELRRVLCPSGRLLLLTTESNLPGAICSRCYKCRTYSRQELRAACEQSGLAWHRELWWSKVHKLLHLGGIVVELRPR